MTDSVVPRFLAGNLRSFHLQNDERLILKRHFVDHLYKEKHKGPNVGPSGTPQIIVLTLEECPGKLTYCFLFSRNYFSQLLASPRAP